MVGTEIENLNQAEIHIKKRLFEILEEEQSFQNKKNELMNGSAQHQIEILSKQSSILGDVTQVLKYLRRNSNGSY